MLHMLGQGQLARSLFPVGAHAEGPDARARGPPRAAGGRQARLAGALLRAGGGDRRVRARRRPGARGVGEVVDPAGRVLGTHDGTFGFTVGQRRGLGVVTGERTYVMEVHAAANRVVVGPHELLARRGLVADRVRWVAGASPGEAPFEAEVRIRYRGQDVPAVVTPSGDEVRVGFRTPQHAVAPGQSLVMYRGDEVLGGGRIVEATR